jgi:acyl-CoA dehydrogenase
VIGFEPTDEQRLLRETAKGFADRSIRPLVERVKREGVGDDPWSLMRPVYAEGVALGLTRIFLPPEHGGMGGSCLDAAVMLEELGAADVGIASDYFSLTACMPLMMMRGGRPDQAQAFLTEFASAPDMVLAGAQSEPNVPGSELMTGAVDPAHGPKLRAEKRGDEYVLSGSKSAFITNAGAASHFFIIARTHPERSVMEGLTVLHVPAGTPGLKVGKRTELIGWPLSTHAELVFEDVAVPQANRIGDEGGAAMLFARLPEMPVCLAACFVGLARQAYETALAYAKERRSTGQPLIEHQAVALRLADMAVELQAARLMVWDAARACETDPMVAGVFKAPAAKAKAVDVAIKCAEGCVKIHGGYGVTREYDAGRYLNDAWIGYSCDFTRDILHLGIARFL